MRFCAKILSLSLLLASVSMVHAQQQGGPPGGDPNGGPGGPGGGPGGGGPDGGPPDPEKMRAMTDKNIKSAMQATDDAWAKLQPLIDKVEDLEHQLDSGPRMHGPPHPEDDGDGPDDDHPQSAIESAITQLKHVLSNKTSTDDQIETATKAVQDAEKKAKDDLAAAQTELKAALNTRQTAVLVAFGVLN
jgi:peptidoglycan hydrolase CwlO-like protein